MHIILSIIIGLSTASWAGPEKTDTLNGVNVETEKSKSMRIYRGKITKSFNQPINSVKNGIVNFTDKCNNSHKARRKFTDKKTDCKYHNENLVESFKVTDINNKEWTKEEGEIERMLLGRQVYNRGSFGFYEVVRIFETKNDRNQKVYKIIQTMLNDQEVNKYTKPAFEKDSAFDETISSFILTEISPHETKLEYEYYATTAHWILNKEVSVPQVFASMSKSINDLMKTIDLESTIQTKELAMAHE
jgi:hypothetical protein